MCACVYTAELARNAARVTSTTYDDDDDDGGVERIGESMCE